jgi:hypothetical protein
MLTDAFTRAIGSMSEKELVRLYNRIMDYVNRGGCPGYWQAWDAPTLRICHPHSYEALNAIAARYRMVAGEGER